MVPESEMALFRAQLGEVGDIGFQGMRPAPAIAVDELAYARYASKVVAALQGQPGLTFPEQLHAPSHPVMKVIVAGTGAMVAVRTKLFTIRQPSGSDVAVGPAFILDTMLSAVNRDVDRRRAQDRMKKVAKRAARVAVSTYPKAYDFLIAGYSILTEFGDHAFDVVFASLESYLKLPPEEDKSC